MTSLGWYPVLASDSCTFFFPGLFMYYNLRQFSMLLYTSFKKQEKIKIGGQHTKIRGGQHTWGDMSSYCPISTGFIDPVVLFTDTVICFRYTSGTVEITGLLWIGKNI